jgi:hypothetical protein
MQPRSALVLIWVVLVLGMVWQTGAGVAAVPATQTTFPPHAVVALRGTPHLWIADESGRLHWGGDTRALQGRVVDWNTRIEMSLDTLNTLQLGDPYLSAGLLKDGIPIYLVKWETTDAQPRLLHIQCIRDVELFGINGSNYSTFVLDRDKWEAQFHIPVSTLQRGELESTDPTRNCDGSTPTPTTIPGGRPRITISRADVMRLQSTLQANHLTIDDVNIARTSTFVLNSAGATVLLAAPLVKSASQSLSDVRQGATVALGVLRLDRDINLSNGKLDADIYLVKAQSNHVVFVDPNGGELSGKQLDTRQLVRTLSRPQAIVTAQDICFGWNNAQVCTEPEPTNIGERGDLQNTMRSARQAIKDANLMSGNEDVTIDSTLSEAEGTQAVNDRRGNLTVAPASSPSTNSPTGVPRDNTLLGILIVTQAIDVPGTPPIAPGQYTARSFVGGTQAVLQASDGRPPIAVPLKTLQVRAAPASGSERTETIIANLCFGNGGNADVCFFGEPDE